MKLAGTLKWSSHCDWPVLCVRCMSSEGDVSFLVSWDCCIGGCGKMDRTKARRCLPFSKMRNEIQLVSMSRIVVFDQRCTVSTPFLLLLSQYEAELHGDSSLWRLCSSHHVKNQHWLGEGFWEKGCLGVAKTKKTWSQIVGPSWQSIFCWRQLSRLLALCSAFVRVQDSQKNWTHTQIIHKGRVFYSAEDQHAGVSHYQGRRLQYDLVDPI